ncbi:MAG: hypothetical protein Phog2KO_40020 [Phototrophicaceae bacterium]
MSDEQSRHPLHDARQQGGHPLSDRVPEPEKPKGRGIPIPLGAEQPILTYTLIAINVVIFVIRYIMPELSNEILLWGYADTNAILQNREFYRLFTSMFLHFNEMHILFNMIALNYIGSNLERLFGHTRFALIYILGGLFGSVLPLFFNSGGLGASGAVFAIWGAEVVFLYQHRAIFGKAGRARLQNSLVLMGFNFFIGFSANALATVADSGVRIGNAAHFGGLLGGLILAWFIAPRFVVRKKTHPELGDDLPVEIVQTNDLNSNISEILFFVCGMVTLVILAIFIRT